MTISVTFLSDEFPIPNTSLYLSGDIEATVEITNEYGEDEFEWELESLVTITGKGTLEDPYVHVPVPDDDDHAFIWATMQAWLKDREDEIWEKANEALYDERH